MASATALTFVELYRNRKHRFIQPHDANTSMSSTASSLEQSRVCNLLSCMPCSSATSVTITPSVVADSSSHAIGSNLQNYDTNYCSKDVYTAVAPTVSTVSHCLRAKTQSGNDLKSSCRKCIDYEVVEDETVEQSDLLCLPKASCWSNLFNCIKIPVSSKTKYRIQPVSQPGSSVKSLSKTVQENDANRKKYREKLEPGWLNKFKVRNNKVCYDLALFRKLPSCSRSKKYKIHPYHSKTEKVKKIRDYRKKIW